MLGYDWGDMMKRYIKSAQQQPTGSALVNKIGMYLYKHLDGAFKYTKDRNTFGVYVTLLYELKEEYGGTKNDVQEMTINISITTYQNKIRVNTIEVTPQARTLGFDLFPIDKMYDMELAMSIIKWKVSKRIQKAYEHYIILF